MDTRKQSGYHKRRLTTEETHNDGKEGRNENLSAHAHAIGKPINPARVGVYVEDNC